MSLLLGQGDGTFNSRIDWMPLAYGTAAVGDLNQDGKLDVAASSGSRWSVLLAQCEP
jgi:hypothetical protein